MPTVLRPTTSDNQKIKDRRRNADRRCSVTSAPPPLSSPAGHPVAPARRGPPCGGGHRRGRGSRLLGALACRRSTAALTRGTAHPQGCQLQAMLPRNRPERLTLYGRPNRGAEASRVSTGVTRAAPVLVERCTSRAGHCAGRMMPEPPGDGSDEPPSAGTALAPPAGVTGRRPAREREGAASTRRAPAVKPI